MMTRIRQMPLRVAGLYAFFGVAWILVTDLGLHALALDPTTEALFQSWKGTLYVLASAALIYFLTSRAVAALESGAAALKRSEARYHLLFDKTPHPIWVYDLDDFDILDANQAAYDCLGYSAAELAHLTMRDLLVPEDRPRFDDLIARYRGIGGGSAGRWRAIGRNGDIIHLDLVSHPIDLEGRTARLVQGKDVSEILAIESSLIDLSQQLLDSASSTHQLAHAAAHELHQPLRQISLELQLLERRYPLPDAQAQNHLHSALEGARRMKNTLDDLVQLTGMDLDRPDFVNLTRVVDDTVDAVQARLAACGGTISLSPLPVVRARERHMRLLFHHLFDNALRFHHPDRPPHIVVSSDQSGGGWRCHIADNGIGIPPEHHLDIFDAFRRLGGGADHPGSGIGLAVCKKIVEQHGGQIAVRSQPGIGSTFSFTLVS